MSKPLFRHKKKAPQPAPVFVTPVGPPEPDYVLRLRWAEDRVVRLSEQIERFMKTQANPFFEEIDPATGEHVFRSRKMGSPPANIGLEISECLFHLRSTLDYVAQRLGDVHSGPIPKANIEELRKPEFPIFGERPPNSREWAKKIGRAHPDAIKIIEDMQPYRGGDYTVHPLWVLHELNNIDKHRMITPVAVARLIKDIHEVNAKTLRARIPLGGPLEAGTEVYRTSYVAINPDLPSYIKVDFIVDIGFDDTSVVAYHPVRAWLTAILEFIKRDVIQALQGYL